MRSSNTFSLLFLPSLLAGCSLFNAPNRDLIIEDGGTPDVVVDAGVDADVGDVPTIDAFDAGPVLREVCETPGDEDGNGLSDCSDFACIGYEGCCSGGTRTGINFLLREVGWSTSGVVQVRGDPDRDVVFPEALGTYMTIDCVPMAQGGVFEVDIEQDGLAPTDCLDNNERCNEFASILLSSVTVAAPDTHIVAEIGIRLYPSGRAELYRERDDVDDVISLLQIDFPAQPLTLILRVTPDVVDGVGVLRAAATVRTSADDFPFPETGVIPQADLLRECGGGISGLHFGVEGRGRRLSVENDNAVRRPLACTNPTQFRDTLSDPLVASHADSSRRNLNWRRPEWSVADVTHPELVREEVGVPPSTVWHVFGSTASRQLEFSTLPDFPWTTAHSTAGTWNGTWTPQDEPFRLADARQPTAVDDGSGLVFIAVVEEGLTYCTPGNCVAIPTGDCPELANPSLVITEQLNYVIFYQCTDEVMGTTVMGRALTQRLQPEGEPFVVLRASDFGSLARNTIIDFDVLLDSRTEEEYLIRAWFVGEALGNVRTLLLATGAIDVSAVRDARTELSALAAGLTLVPYPANPIATENVLFRDPNQSLQGVSVERMETPRDLLFLFGRRTEYPTGRVYDFVPIEQTWGTL